MREKITFAIPEKATEEVPAEIEVCWLGVMRVRVEHVTHSCEIPAAGIGGRDCSYGTKRPARGSYLEGPCTNGVRGTPRRKEREGELAMRWAVTPSRQELAQCTSTAQHFSSGTRYGRQDRMRTTRMVRVCSVETCLYQAIST
jgi:hypothetical protein